MQIKVIRSEVLCEGVSLGYYNVRIPVYSAAEITGIRAAFIDAFGTDAVEWYHPRLAIGIDENEDVTNFLRSRTALFQSGGFMFRDAYATLTMKTLQTQSANFIQTFYFTEDLTDAIMRIPAGAHGGADSQYEYREIIFRNAETGDEARWIHDTYDPSISSTGSHLSRLYPASSGSGYSYTSLSFGFGSNGTDSMMEVAMPYLVMSEDSVIGYGSHLLMPSNDKIITRYNLITTGPGNGYTDISQLPLALPELSDYLLSDGVMVDPDDTSDPYGEGGFSGTGGGTGTFSGTGDAISIPSLPTLSATAAGFITLFNPSASQMASLAAYMWTGAFDLDTFKKIFANPMDCILGLSIVPVDVPAGAAAVVKVGNISTGISMTTAASQYVEVDCGTLNVEEFWGAYLDYDPYTKAEIYLPYIGTHPIAVDDIMGKSVHVVYHVDILSGACIAYIQCGGTVLYSFIGQCSSSIPITGNDWTNVVNGVLSIAGSIGSMVATGGASAPAAVGNIMSTAVNQMKPSVEKSGSLSGTGGMMGVQTPYLILTRPRQALPRSQNAYTGYPSFIHEDLGTLSGYTEVEEIHLENVPATDGEITEIVSLLKGGVIF